MTDLRTSAGILIRQLRSRPHANGKRSSRSLIPPGEALPEPLPYGLSLRIARRCTSGGAESCTRPQWNHGGGYSHLDAGSKNCTEHHARHAVLHGDTRRKVSPRRRGWFPAGYSLRGSCWCWMWRRMSTVGFLFPTPGGHHDLTRVPTSVEPVAQLLRVSAGHVNVARVFFARPASSATSAAAWSDRWC